MAIATLIGTVWGIVKYYDVKRTKTEAENTRKEEERNNLFKEMVQKLEKIDADNNSQHEHLGLIQHKVDEMQTKVENIQVQIDENEMDRLRSDIINGVNKLQNGLTMSQADFEHIHHCYDKYTSKGGNSYIESCMDYVTEYEEECRRNGVGVGYDET